MEPYECGVFPVKDALEIVLIFEQSGEILYANTEAEKNLEYQGDLCGRKISEIFPSEFKEVQGQIVTDYTFGHELRKLVAYRKNLTCFPVRARIIEAEGLKGTYICMANVILEEEYLGREVLKRKQEVEQALKVKSEFVANVTHELRTPVNGILGHVRELSGEETDNAKLRTLKVMERCCEDMNKIINNILDFSKLEAGKFVLEPRRFHVRDMLDYVKSNHIGKITEKGLDFFMTISPQVPEYIIGDELRIEQILNNLLSNALKFTSVGKITLEVFKTAQVGEKVELFFIVVDSGIGIEEGDKDKLFQSFSQVDASISRKYGGTGLGLNICKQLVELMGGRIGVESEKNKGSAFSFSIWAEVDKTEEEKATGQETFTTGLPLPGVSFLEEGSDALKQYGSAENKEALSRNLSKLILCVEMENWEKAEMFMETVRELCGDAPREVGRIVLRLKMAVQKENYEKSAAGIEELRTFCGLSKGSSFQGT